MHPYDLTGCVLCRLWDTYPMKTFAGRRWPAKTACIQRASDRPSHQAGRKTNQTSTQRNKRQHSRVPDHVEDVVHKVFVATRQKKGRTWRPDREVHVIDSLRPPAPSSSRRLIQSVPRSKTKRKGKQRACLSKTTQKTGQHSVRCRRGNASVAWWAKKRKKEHGQQHQT